MCSTFLVCAEIILCEFNVGFGCFLGVLFSVFGDFDGFSCSSVVHGIEEVAGLSLEKI